MPIAGITDYSHVRVTVTDIARSRAFYDNVFGFTVYAEVPADADEQTKKDLWFVWGGVIYQFPGGLLGLRPVAQAGDGFDPDRVGLDHLSFTVADVDALNAAAAVLDGLGVAHEGVKVASGMGLLEFSDPDGVTISVAHAGSGPALLLLHGNPQSGAMWHQVAPELTTDHTVVVTDLRGYGDSTRPTTAPGTDHAEHSFRAMAADQVQVMAALGHGRFTVIGHDRGARTAHRMALDHPGAVERLAVLDIVPTRHVLATVDATVAQAYYHWFFLSQPEPLPRS